MNKASKINAIIAALNIKIMQENKSLCAAGRHAEQKPNHGDEMFLQLAFMDDADLDQIAKASGV
jgi:hypothetical protein